MDCHRIDPDLASQANEDFSSVLFLNVPKGTICGLDIGVYTVGEKFKGMKMIPSGVHFFSTSSVNKEHGVAPPLSWFVLLEHSEIIVRRWNSREERLECLGDDDEEERFKLGVGRLEFDDCLGPYDFSKWKEWRQLSCWITKSTIDRILGSLEFISPSDDILGGLSDKSPCEAALLRQLESAGEEKTSSPQLQYVSFPHLVKKTNLSATELTHINLDKTEALKEILTRDYNGQWEDLLGEMQFCFVGFLFGQSLASLEQWKAMVHLLLGCIKGTADSNLEKLLAGFLRCLRHQMRFVLSHDETESISLFNESFLKKDLIQYLQFITQEDSLRSIKTQCAKITSMVKQTLGWKIPEEEEEEYAPVVVDI